MSLILPSKWNNNQWEQTAAEKRGYVTTKHGVMEGGWDGSAVMLRRELAPQLVQELTKLLWAMRNKMADLSWDDEQTMVAIGIQVRNQWYEIEGEWFEKDTQEWQNRLVEKAKKREI